MLIKLTIKFPDRLTEWFFFQCDGHSIHALHTRTSLLNKLPGNLGEAIREMMDWALVQKSVLTGFGSKKE